MSKLVEKGGNMMDALKVLSTCVMTVPEEEVCMICCAMCGGGLGPEEYFE